MACNGMLFIQSCNWPLKIYHTEIWIRAAGKEKPSPLQRDHITNVENLVEGLIWFAPHCLSYLYPSKPIMSSLRWSANWCERRGNGFLPRKELNSYLPTDRDGWGWMSRFCEPLKITSRTYETILLKRYSWPVDLFYTFVVSNVYCRTYWSI